MNKKTTYLLLALIIVLGAFLRIYGLGDESFWVDESSTAYGVKQTYSYIIHNINSYATLTPEYFKAGGGEVPLYYILIRFWAGINGLSEFSLRLFSAIFGILSLCVIFKIGKMIFNDKVGLLSAFIMSINHQHIFYSQEARNYSFLVFLTLLSFYFFIKALNNNKNLSWILYSLCAVAMIYTHYLSFLILMSQYIFVLIFHKSYRLQFRKALISAFGVFIAYLAWTPVLIKQIFHSQYPYSSIYKPTIGKLIYVFIQINSWISPDFQSRIALRSMNLNLLTVLGWASILCILSITIILASMSLIGALKNKHFSMRNLTDKNKCILLFWFFIPIIVPFLLSLLFPSASIVGFVQYIMFATPPYFILASKGILTFKKHFMAILILLAILSIIPVYSYYANFDKEQWRDAAAYLKNNNGRQDIILINKPVSELALKYYYNTANSQGVNDVEEAKSATAGKSSFWLLYSAEKFSDSGHSIKKYFDSQYTLKEQKEFTGILLYHYES